MAAACLLCGTITANKNRKLLDLTKPTMFNRCIKWLYQVSLAENGKSLASSESVFCDKANFCRKCFKSFQTFSEKASTYLKGIDGVLSHLELIDSESFDHSSSFVQNLTSTPSAWKRMDSVLQVNLHAILY